MSSNTATPDQEIIQGDCIDEMQAMDADSVHAVVCDPPYGLEFMSMDWDRPKSLLEGERGFAGDSGFGGGEGDRNLPTSHTTGRNVKCRKCEKWKISGSPCECDDPDFPHIEATDGKLYQAWCEQWASEALRVLKPGGHLIAFSGNRTHHRLFTGIEDAGFEIRDTLTWHQGQGFPKGATVSQYMDGEDAEQWDGFKTSLKPATEFAVLARAPMSESAVYRNVLEHGTGALNIGRTRIPTDEGGRPNRVHDHSDNTQKFGINGNQHGSAADGVTTEGRYPANLLLDGVASRMLDEQSGSSKSPETYERDADGNAGLYEGQFGQEDGDVAKNYGDEGGASRFFYTAKASKSERTIDGQIDNEHPTVKPLDLMEWLVTLVTAPGQRVLDPFAGSGTTIMACRRLNREGIGIEKDAEHADLARKRVALAHELETERVPATGAEAEPDDTDEPATLESFADADDD